MPKKREVPISLLFSRIDKWGSKCIAKYSGPLAPAIAPAPSHVAVLVDNKWVHESTLHTGVRVIPYSKWRAINEEVANIQCGHMDYSVIKEWYRDVQSRRYDWPGLVYLGFFILLHYFFKKPIPIFNRWQSNRRYFCCEVAGRLLKEDLSMMAPNQVLLLAERRAEPQSPAGGPTGRA